MKSNEHAIGKQSQNERLLEAARVVGNTLNRHGCRFIQCVGTVWLFWSHVSLCKPFASPNLRYVAAPAPSLSLSALPTVLLGFALNLFHVRLAK